VGRVVDVDADVRQVHQLNPIGQVYVEVYPILQLVNAVFHVDGDFSRCLLLVKKFVGVLDDDFSPTHVLVTGLILVTGLSVPGGSLGCSLCLKQQNVHL
jgi:hypothetical protein